MNYTSRRTGLVGSDGIGGGCALLDATAARGGLAVVAGGVLATVRSHARNQETQTDTGLMARSSRDQHRASPLLGIAGYVIA